MSGLISFSTCAYSLNQNGCNSEGLSLSTCDTIYTSCVANSSQSDCVRYANQCQGAAISHPNQNCSKKQSKKAM